LQDLRDVFLPRKADDAGRLTPVKEDNKAAAKKQPQRCNDFI